MASAVTGANQTSQDVKTTAQTLSDENATTRQKAAAIVDTALSAAGTVGSAMLAASSARDAAQELATVKGYFEKAQCPGAGQAASGGGSKSLNPNDIRFSQSSVNGSSQIVESMKKNGWVGDPIDVVQMPDGRFTTIDNTRVIAARQTGIDVQAKIHAYDEALPVEYIDRFTTKQGVPATWGDAISFRIGKQNSAFRNNNPFGSFSINNVK